ncbi:hypothetical protein, partial [Kribbella sp. NPDC048915]|uniref:hypothetical protein n=1 Tax=Kribbella sp. NPDC048915 TaxID=3155148 RepID=UPI0033EB3FDF
MDLAVDDGDVPAAGVQVDVMATAQQRQVRDLGRAAVQPGDQMVGVAHDRRRPTHDTTPVTGVQRMPHRLGDQPLTT